MSIIVPVMPQSWILPHATPPHEFCQAVQALVAPLPGQYIAQLLWQRGIRDRATIPGFLQAQHYQPHRPDADCPDDFAAEMHLAVKRLQQARSRQEKVAIWGDFDADGVTATAVLWDGFGQFFRQNEQLTYYIPNRLTESHGLSHIGLDQLHAQGYRLIVTCDTGSTNLAEIAYAHSLGMEIIVTDHHTLADVRPDVVAIVNPRALDPAHPFATLSGVAVAFKLVEALYLALPDVPTQPLTNLLDLVAIGLIADLVELKGDCRYLAQQGIAQLQTQSNPATATRPGIARLLELCKRSGDRPTDISFGIGPRINAVSRIQGDAHFCVELLTSQDADRARQLADETELANTRRKALQQDIYQQAAAKVQQLDLSTTDVLVLWDEQWHPGVLGLVASQLAQEYGRPAIVLSLDGLMARGSARSARQIDLYQLVKAQAHLIDRFGGHPFAAGLSLTQDNLPIFAAAVNRQLRQQLVDVDLNTQIINADLVVTVADLGLELYKEIKLLEPCGMGNPSPQLWIQDCWFSQKWQRNIQDFKGQKVKYIKTEFEILDASTEKGFPGIWWGHYQEELPVGHCDVLVELENNPYKKRYEVRLLAVRSSVPSSDLIGESSTDLVMGTDRLSGTDWLIDHRQSPQAHPANTILLTQAPSSWYEMQTWFRRALQTQQHLAIAYQLPPSNTPPLTETQTWQDLVGIAKYLSRTGTIGTRQQIQTRLGISELTLKVGFQSLQQIGFSITSTESGFQMQWDDTPAIDPTIAQTVLASASAAFVIALREEKFRQQYFAQMPFALLQAMAARSMAEIAI
jgi:single-stranded-DNA-specific exonuclease